RSLPVAPAFFKLNHRLREEAKSGRDRLPKRGTGVVQFALGYKTAFPGERMADDGAEVVEFRRPAQQLADTGGGGDRDDDVSGPALAEIHREIVPDGEADRIQHLADRIAAAVAAVERGAHAVRPQIVQRSKVRAGEVADMDEIADAGAVWRGVVGAEHVDLGAAAECCFDRDLDEMGGARRR